jgi:AraC-like DNA-binding protein
MAPDRKAPAERSSTRDVPTGGRAQFASATRPGVPIPRIDLSGLPTDQQLDLWDSVARHGYSTRSAARTPLDMAVAGARVDQLIVTEYQSRSHLAERSEELVRRRPARFVKLRLYRRGGARIFHGAVTYPLGTAAIHVIDHSRAWTAFNDGPAYLSLFVPHGLIDYDPTRHPVCLSLPLEGVRGAILAEALRALHDRLPALEPSDAPAVALGISGLLRGMLWGTALDSSETAHRDERRRAMRAYLERHLREPDLGVERLCRAFNVGRATVYRDFADAGGVERYVFERRLERAFLELMEQPAMRGAVQRVADDWGFASLSHFSRAFLARFGMRPSDAAAFTMQRALAAPPLPSILPPDLAEARAGLARMYDAITSL